MEQGLKLIELWFLIAAIASGIGIFALALIFADASFKLAGEKISKLADILFILALCLFASATAGLPIKYLISL